MGYCGSPVVDALEALVLSLPVSFLRKKQKVVACGQYICK